MTNNNDSIQPLVTIKTTVENFKP